MTEKVKQTVKLYFDLNLDYGPIFKKPLNSKPFRFPKCFKRTVIFWSVQVNFKLYLAMYTLGKKFKKFKKRKTRENFILCYRYGNFI